MRYAKTTLIAAASGLALLGSLALPAGAMPSFAPTNASSGHLILVKGGGGHGGGYGGGGGAHFAGAGGEHFSGGSGRFASIGGGGGMGMRGAPHGDAFAHMGGGHNARIARGGDFDGGRDGRMANNWNGNWSGARHGRMASNWDGNRHGDHHHRHGHFNRFYVYPFFYGNGDYYAYGDDYGSCAWLYRRAVRTNSQYWWNRYYACVG